MMSHKLGLLVLLYVISVGYVIPESRSQKVVKSFWGVLNVDITAKVCDYIVVHVKDVACYVHLRVLCSYLRLPRSRMH